MPLETSPHRKLLTTPKSAPTQSVVPQNSARPSMAVDQRVQAPTRRRKENERSQPTDILEKDEVELRLEKALFGDDAGFLESLKRNEAGRAQALIQYRDPEKGGPSDEEEDGGLSDVADEDVSNNRLHAFSCRSLTLPLAVLPRLWNRPTSCLHLQRSRMRRAVAPFLSKRASVVRQ